jgi:hypothetical protein
VIGRDILATDGRHGRRGASLRNPVPRAARVDEAGEHVVGKSSRLRATLQNLGEPLGLESLELALRKRRLQDNLGDKCHGIRET